MMGNGRVCVVVTINPAFVGAIGPSPYSPPDQHLASAPKVLFGSWTSLQPVLQQNNSALLPACSRSVLVLFEAEFHAPCRRALALLTDMTSLKTASCLHPSVTFGSTNIVFPKEIFANVLFPAGDLGSGSACVGGAKLEAVLQECSALEHGERGCC